jgi:hypothetical protein
MGHRRHGYLAAAGVGTSMVAGFALALLVVSAVIGFRGWPSSSVTPPLSVSILPAADAPAAPALTRAVARVVLPAASVRSRFAPAPARGRRHPAAVPPAAPSRRPDAAPIPSRSADGVVPKTAASATPTTVTDTPSAPRSGDAIRRTTEDTGATVQQTTQQTAQAASPVAPAAGDAVQATGQGVAGALKSTGDAVGGVVDALTP